MKAIRFHQLGGPDVLQYEEVEKPSPKPGEALIKVSEVGVNFADTLFSQGAYLRQPQLPDTPGGEGSGIVEAIGDNVSEKLIGQRVAFLGDRAYAEYTTVNAKALIPLPDAVSFADGAAFPVQALTAYHMLFTCDQVKPGTTVLIHAAAGGVGLIATQMAKLAGATVYGTTSSEEKAQLAREYGADEIVLYNQVDFAEEIKRLTNGRGVDLILDSVGKTTMEGSFKSLAPFGHLISYGAASGRPDPIDLIRCYENSVKVSGFWLVTAMREPEIARAGVMKVFEWMTSGKLKLLIGLHLPLAQAAEAHRKLSGRDTVGKILLKVAD